MYQPRLRFLSCILILALLFTLVACSASEEKSVVENTSAPAVSAAVIPEEVATLETVSEDKQPAKNENHESNNDLSSLLNSDLKIPLSYLMLPKSSAEFSLTLAQQALALCSGHTKDATSALLQKAGFKTLLQANFDKSDDDPSHNCAYTIGKKQVIYGGKSRTLLLVAIRGTNAGEWYSNFDFSPSHSDETTFAENFLFAAQDVFLGMQEILKGEDDPLVLVCGHSRGAACANLLGVLLNATCDPANVFVYTYATPATVHGGDLGVDCSNIFNLINPCDIVPMMPMAAWGYSRAGKDIVLPGDKVKAARLTETMDDLYKIAPTISQYYKERHSLTSSGLSETGLTTFEMMLSIGKSLTGITTDAGADWDNSVLDGFSEDSDFHPLVEALEKASGNNGEKAKAVLQQHLPNTYQLLMAEMAKQN